MLTAHAADTSCSPLDISVMTHTHSLCINMAPVYKGSNVMCKYICVINPGDTYVYLMAANKQMQICEMNF